MGEVRKVAGVASDESQEQDEVTHKAQREARTVHFATLVGLCHLMKSEMEQKLQKYKGCVVLRGAVVKDDSGSYAVFTVL